jgi:hypothetical protein
MTQFMQDYYYLFLQGNDTVTQLSTNDLFAYVIFNLEERARQLLSDPSAQSWSAIYKTQRYTYLQLHDQALTAFVKGLFTQAAPTQWVPQPTSSILMEFYQVKAAAAFERENFAVKVLNDDAPLSALFAKVGIQCSSDNLCPWDKVAALMESRKFDGAPWGGKTLQ